MSAVRRQHRASTPAAACLRALLALALCCPGIALAQLRPTAEPEQSQPAAEQAPEAAQDGQERKRGIATQAAREATESLQDREAGKAPAQPTEDADPTVAPGMADVATDAASPAAPPERGVLFRIIPPVAPLLPAEAMQAASAAGAASAEGTTAMPPPVPRASYLLGTIHFGTAEEQGIDYELLSAIASEVETFVNEADIDAAWKPDYDGYRWLPVETPLGGMVGADDLAMARALLPGIRAEDLERMKPWAVLSLLEARGESGGEVTMDARLQRMAGGAGKRLVHLETLEQQLQALDCVPAAEHAQVLDERLRKSWILRIESAEAMAYYRSRNLDAWLANIDELEGLSEQARAIEQRARHCLLEERNARWIGQLQTLFQDGPCLVAVGAIHLVGPDGLIARLRRDGYQVEAMPL